MVMMTYQLPDSMKEIAEQGQFNEFSLNRFLKQKEKVMMQSLYMKMRYKSGLN